MVFLLYSLPNVCSEQFVSLHSFIFTNQMYDHFSYCLPPYTLFTTNDQKQLFWAQKQNLTRWLVSIIEGLNPFQNFVHIIYLSRNIQNLGHIGSCFCCLTKLNTKIFRKNLTTEKKIQLLIAILGSEIVKWSSLTPATGAALDDSRVSIGEGWSV